MLQSLLAWLDKAQENAPDAEAMLSRRLAPDMYPLSTQIRFACFQAQEATFRLRGGMTFDMTGEQYARDWALAQFYFHLVTAYAILRGEGLELGKADYVPHMFAYLRPGTMPPG